jgi:hypothetical protein
MLAAAIITRSAVSWDELTLRDGAAMPAALIAQNAVVADKSASANFGTSDLIRHIERIPKYRLILAFTDHKSISLRTPIWMQAPSICGAHGCILVADVLLQMK